MLYAAIVYTTCTLTSVQRRFRTAIVGLLLLATYDRSIYTAAVRGRSLWKPVVHWAQHNAHFKYNSLHSYMHGVSFSMIDSPMLDDMNTMLYLFALSCHVLRPPITSCGVVSGQPK